MKAMMKDKIAALVVMGVLSAANIAFADSGIWNVSAGKDLDISAMNTSAYGVTRVGQKGDGSYVVQAVMDGFQSEVETAITFAADGETIQSIEIVRQGETDGIGSQVADAAFTGQFTEIQAPIILNGKEVDLVSPATGAGADGAVAVAAEVTEEQPESQLSDPSQWNPEDQSPEAQAYRALYSAGLTGTAMEGKPLDTPVVDLSAEEQAEYRLKEAGLSETTEEKAEETATSPVISAQGTAVDAVSGATISSTAVVNAVNHAYFFLKEEME